MHLRRLWQGDRLKPEPGALILSRVSKEDS